MFIVARGDAKCVFLERHVYIIVCGLGLGRGSLSRVFWIVSPDNQAHKLPYFSEAIWNRNLMVDPG